jgi:hypothetical protein
MLKKIMKAALAASLVFSMSSFAYAEDGVSIGGSFKEYFGQYNAGTAESAAKAAVAAVPGNAGTAAVPAKKAYTAHFATIGEANLMLKGTSGKMSVYHEMEANDKYGTATDYNNTQTRLSYTSGFGLLTLGNVTNIMTIPFVSSAWKTSNIPNSTMTMLSTAGYSESEGFDIQIPLEGLGGLQFTLYPIHANAAAATVNAVAQGLGGTAQTDTQGLSWQLGANLKISGLGVRAGYATAATANPTETVGSTYKAMETTNMRVGVMYPISDTLSVAFDYASAEVKNEVWSTTATKWTTMALGATVKAMGPGTLVVAYDTDEMKGTQKWYDQTTTSINYDIPVAKGAGIQVGYITNTQKYDTKTVPGAKAVTVSFAGAGFYAAF